MKIKVICTLCYQVMTSIGRGKSKTKDTNWADHEVFLCETENCSMPQVIVERNIGTLTLAKMSKLYQDVKNYEKKI